MKRHKRTIRKPALGIVRGGLVRSLVIIPIDYDVIPAGLVPCKHLLRALDAVVWFTFAPDRRLRGSNGSGARGPGHIAFEGCLVHVWLAASIDV